jgi:predicted secreted hydrolase
VRKAEALRAGLLLVVAIAAGAAVAAGPGGWLRVEGPPELSFPADHGPHPRYRSEWWYVTGIVADRQGGRRGFQLTFFRQGLDPDPVAPGQSDLRARQVLAAHLAVADVPGGRFLAAQRLRRADDLLAGWRGEGLDLWLEGWSVRLGPDGVLHLAADDRAAGIALELALEPTRPLVLQGVDGFSAKGPEPGNASVYLSWTRLATRGTLTVGGRTLEVTGTSWMDHEWGTSQLGPGVVGWDWFSLRLGDGRDLMVYRLRRADGSADPASSGTLVAAGGSTRRLTADQVVLEPRGTWASPVTGAVYPVRWRLAVPSAGIELDLIPLLDDAEVDGRATTGVAYWEGPVAASGSVPGEGYVELTGYAGGLSGRL